MSAVAPSGLPPELDAFCRRWRAAEELWAQGYPAESYMLLRDGLRQVAAALQGTQDRASALTPEIDALLGEAEALGDQLGPAAYTRDHAVWLERARNLSSRLLREIRQRKRRIGGRTLVEIAVGGGLVAAVLVVLWVSSGRIHVAASGEYSDEFPARHAVDNLSATEWLLPGGQPGHLDLVFPKKRSVRAVVLTNSHNRQHMDRACKRARVVVFDDAREVDEGQVVFTAVEAVPTPRRVALSGRQGTRVKVEVLEYFELGGGLAEVSVE